MQRNIARSTVVRYGVAVASVAVAVVLGLWLRHLALAAAQLLLIAILIAGWVGGLRPALVAWGLATLALGYYFTVPVEGIPRLAIFSLVAAFMATMSAARRKAEDALKSTRDGLEERVRERTALLRDRRACSTSPTTACSCATWPTSSPTGTARPRSSTDGRPGRRSARSLTT